jgi:hypothetical protein
MVLLPKTLEYDAERAARDGKGLPPRVAADTPDQTIDSKPE